MELKYKKQRIHGILSVVCAVNYDISCEIVDYMNKNYSYQHTPLELSYKQLIELHTYAENVFRNEVKGGRAKYGNQGEEHAEKLKHMLFHNRMTE